MICRLSLSLLLALPLATASGQGIVNRPDLAIGAGPRYQQFQFDDQGDFQSAALFVVPVSFRKPIGDKLLLDVATAHASGYVDANGVKSQLVGLVDTKMRLKWSVSDGSRLIFGASLPTGLSRHTSEQAAVASALSNDLLGFAQNSWGSGASLSIGGMTARRIADWTAAFGANYQFTAKYKPVSDSSLTYNPGDLTSAYFGLGRRLKNGELSLSLSGDHYAFDRADNRNVFQGGLSLNGDVTYSVNDWTMIVANVWRDRGQLLLPNYEETAGVITYLGDSSYTVGHQNMILFGVSKSIRYSEKRVFVPKVGFRTLSRETRPGRGWMANAGITTVMQVRGFEILPTVGLNRGMMVPVVNTSKARPFWGFELGLEVTRRFKKRDS